MAEHRSLKREQMQIDALLYPEKVEHPETVGDCWAQSVDVGKPCAYIGCKYNLYMDRTKGGDGLMLPQHEPWDQPADKSCVLDVVKRNGAMNNDEIAEVLNVTPERIRQIVAVATIKFRIGMRKRKYELP